jgi:amidase
VDTERRTGRAPLEADFEPLTWHYYLRSRERTAFDQMRSLDAVQRGAAAIERFLEHADVWLTPTLAQPPLPLGSFLPVPDSLPRYLTFSPFTRLANLSGIPAMSVPLFWSDGGIPIGTHFAAPLGGERTLFGLAAQLEEARPWADRHPPAAASAATEPAIESST